MTASTVVVVVRLDYGSRGYGGTCPREKQAKRERVRGCVSQDRKNEGGESGTAAVELCRPCMFDILGCAR